MTRRAHGAPGSGLGAGALTLLVVLLALGVGAGVVAVMALAGHGGNAGGRVLATPAVSGAPTSRGGAARPEGGSAGSSAGAEGDEAYDGTAAVPAREVLREWDVRRSWAWVRGDPQALARLYVPRSLAGRRDVALLGRWNTQGARVTHLEPQLLALRVLSDEGRRLVVRVTDRVGVVRAEVRGREVVLPQDLPTTRVVTMLRGPRSSTTWRVATVRAAAPGPTPAPPGRR